MKLLSLFLYRGDTTTSACPNYRTLLGRLVRASACVIAMASIATSAFAAGPNVYVGNFKDNTVSFIDTTAGIVVAAAKRPMRRFAQVWRNGTTRRTK